MRKILLLSILFFFIACNNYKGLPSETTDADWRVQSIPSTPQPTTGIAEKGKHYMFNGDFIGTGIPLAFVEKRLTDIDTVLNRTGTNQKIPYALTAFKTANGEEVSSWTEIN